MRNDTDRGPLTFGFWGGFVATALVAAVLAGVAQLTFGHVGELDIRSVVDRQQSAKQERLFASGLHQQAMPYKFALVDAIQPEVVALGSSRAMQVRGRFFTRPFVNMGGAVNNVAELELAATRLSQLERAPALTIVFADPWWFNRRYTAGLQTAGESGYPSIVSADMIAHGAALFRRGNWIAEAGRSGNLGIFSILRGEGYGRDGSFHYRATLSGQTPSTDVRFSDTLQRIAGDRARFEKGAAADSALVGRACAALRTIRRSGGRVVVVAPPFANPVRARMEAGGYAYLDQAFAGLSRCGTDIPVFNYTTLTDIPGSGDCEFVDGVHGGDVIYARMIRLIAASDPQTRAVVDAPALDRFIERNAGLAGGETRDLQAPYRENDFLRLGCPKTQL